MASILWLPAAIRSRPKLLATAAAVVALLAIGVLTPAWLNSYQRNGTIALKAHEPAGTVEILRDAHGVPYIIADTLADSLWGQGFALAQDRPFDLEIRRRLVNGTLAELLGEGALPADILVHTIGMRRLAKARLAQLDPQERALLTAFVEGINAFISHRDGQTALEFRLVNLGRQGEAPPARSLPWSLLDVVALFYFQAFYFARYNIDIELAMQTLLEQVPGDVAAALTPLTPNPDDPPNQQANAGAGVPTAIRDTFRAVGLDPTASLFSAPQQDWAAAGDGSNAWAISGKRSTTGEAIMVNDPHLDIRRLPGPWHPIALLLPGRSIVGANIGLPGIFTGRSGDVALGVTVGYADTIDLYIEELNPTDPGAYRADGGEAWARFVTETIEIKVRDRDAENGMRSERHTVARTQGGRIVVIGPERLKAANRAVSLRWSVAESEALRDPHLGIRALLQMATIEDGLEAADALDLASLTLVFADTSGRIARKATGRVPARGFAGIAPRPGVRAVEDWRAGPVPPDRMPGEFNPTRGWTGSANQMVASGPSASRFATLTAHSGRYRRMRSVFGDDRPISPERAWQATFDIENNVARALAPIIVAALRGEAETERLAAVLTEWDFQDATDTAAPLIFQAVIVELAEIAYGRLVDVPARTALLRHWEIWLERLAAGIKHPQSTPLFVDAATRDAAIRSATRSAKRKLAATYGQNPRTWRWGDAHQLRFVGPLCASEEPCWLGGRAVAWPGSGQTLFRGGIHYRLTGSNRFDPWSVTSLRLMVDFATPDRIRYALPGGVVGRTFHTHLSDGIEAALDPESRRYLWTTRAAARAHARHRLVLRGQAGEAGEG